MKVWPIRHLGVRRPPPRPFPVPPRPLLRRAPAPSCRARPSRRHAPRAPVCAPVASPARAAQATAPALQAAPWWRHRRAPRTSRRCRRASWPASTSSSPLRTGEQGRPDQVRARPPRTTPVPWPCRAGAAPRECCSRWQTRRRATRPATARATGCRHRWPRPLRPRCPPRPAESPPEELARRPNGRRLRTRSPSIRLQATRTREARSPGAAWSRA